MVKLRLRRTGKKHIPSYQIVVIHSQKARNAMYLEKIGHYYPLDNKYDLDAEKTLKWLRQGAQPTKLVLTLLKKEKIWTTFCNEKLTTQNAKEKVKKTTTTVSKKPQTSKTPPKKAKTTKTTTKKTVKGEK